ncbi:MAG: hypothetical protein ACRDKJ_05880 [Actinomycetota bacterium]
MLTADDRSRLQSKARAAIDEATLRKDPWWAYPVLVLGFLGVMMLYSTWAGLQTTGYYAEPYISPIFSPCLAVNCEHTTFRLLGEWWFLSPALLVMWLPILFRFTCYYYRKAYYRAAFFSPPACAVREPLPRYNGETKLLIFQNLHRYFFYLMLVNMVFLGWDTVKAFMFPGGFGIGVGSLVFVVMIATMSLYIASCHSCRHAVGGNVDLFSRAPIRHRAWMLVSRLNKRHGIWALASLFWIPVTDLYVRLVAAGVITDYRIF